MKEIKRKFYLCLTVLLLIATAAPLQSAAEDNWTITKLSTVDYFVVSRKDYSKTEKIYCRIVGLSAYRNIHFNALYSSFVFEEGDGSHEFKFTEYTNIGSLDLPFSYQAVPTRDYRFEVLDDFGNILATYVNSINASDWQYNGSYLSKTLDNPIYFNGTNYASGMASNKYLDVYYPNSPQSYGYYSVDDGDDYAYGSQTINVYDDFTRLTGATGEYFQAVGYKLFATLGFTQREVNDGYQYIQILADNSETYDGKDPDGKVNTPSKSIYKACFELSTSTTAVTTDYRQFFPHRYDYKTKTDEINGRISITEFSHEKGKLYEQEFQDASYRATNAGALILDPKVSTLTVRFDANGSGDDTWMHKDLFFRLGLLDNTPPTVTGDIHCSSGPTLPGNQTSISVPFNEIVQVSGTPKLITTWGDFNYEAGSGTNVLTFTGNITAPSGTQLTISGLSGTVTDLAGNNFTWRGTNTMNGYKVTQIYTITYNLDGGTTDNPDFFWTGNYDITLKNPVREGYIFCGWTGSNGDSPQGVVTIPNGSTGDRTYTAHWLKVSSGNGTNNNPYIISTTTELDAVATAVKNGNSFTGEYIKLGADIAYSTEGLGETDENFTTIGGYFNGSDKDFGGTFFGDGHTISGIRLCKPLTNQNENKNQALFGRISSTATISYVRLANASITGYRNVGGIVGNCDDGHVYHCFVIESTITCGDTYVGALVGRGPSYGYTNNYYYNCTVNGTPCATNVAIGGNGGVSASSDKSGARCVYALTLDTGIRASGTSITYNGIGYSIAGSTITLSYQGDGGFNVDQYIVNGTPLEGNTFVMPSEDVTVTTAKSPSWSGDGSEDNPYIITTPAQLNALAEMVKSGETYSGKYFELGADIAFSTTDLGATGENFTPIGGYFDGSDKDFCGNFDGKGYYIRYIRLYKDPTVATSVHENKNQALFGRIKNATVKNVTLYGARITGLRIVAGIVGNCDNSTVENCLVLYSTLISGNNYAGAVIGFNYSNSSTFIGNHYMGCTVTVGEESANTGVGVGGNNGISTSKDLNGVRSVHKLTLPNDVTATGESVTINSVPYFASNTTVTLSYSGEGHPIYSVNGTPIQGNTFTMLAENVTVTVEVGANPTPGDLNGDGNVDVSDVSILIDVVLGKDVTLAPGAATDLNGDNNVDVSDVSLLIDIILGKN